jgi:hypothetical protein
LVEYIGSKTKVKIICKEHGIFEQRPESHLIGQGCRFCNYEILSENNRFTTDEFIKRSLEIHGDKYDYSLVEYKNIYTKVKIICKEHGVFEQSPNAHYASGCGCKQCIYPNILLPKEKRIELNRIRASNIYHSLSKEEKKKRQKENTINMSKSPDRIFRARIRSNLNGAIKRGYFIKNSHTEDIIGCSFEELKIYLENQFTYGMNWDNQGLWHIDHFFPIVRCKIDIEDSYKYLRYTNLRPLWAFDNLSKNDNEPYKLLFQHTSETTGSFTIQTFLVNDINFIKNRFALLKKRVANNF